MKFAPNENIKRRTALVGLGSLAALPFLPGCDPDVGAMDGGGADAGAPGDAETLDADPSRDAALGDASQDADSDASHDASGAGWAAGGTAAMTGAAAYPNPFTEAPDPACALTLATTLGPCFYTSPVRRDVSEGYPGLPIRLAFRVLNERCAPLAGARVDIWHTGNTGLYSGGPIDFCTGGDAEAISRLYFRGAQLTGSDGVLSFDTCFPGAYAGRALHVHLQVFPAGSGAASIISQVFFPQPLIDEIFTTHPDYTPHASPDTRNADDSIYTGVGSAALVNHERMADGAMLAWKDIIMR